MGQGSDDGSDRDFGFGKGLDPYQLQAYMPPVQVSGPSGRVCQLGQAGTLAVLGAAAGLDGACMLSFVFLEHFGYGAGFR